MNLLRVLAFVALLSYAASQVDYPTTVEAIQYLAKEVNTNQHLQEDVVRWAYDHDKTGDYTALRDTVAQCLGHYEQAIYEHPVVYLNKFRGVVLATIGVTES